MATDRDTVLVTGAGGFVGSAIVRHLARPQTLGGVLEGRLRHVAALVRPGSSIERLAECADAVRIVRADLTDSDALRAVLDEVRPATVVHAALPARFFAELGEDESARLIDGPLRVLCRGLESGARIVTTGTGAVVPSGPAMTESDPLVPNPFYLDYARNKIHEEQVLARETRKQGLEWVHLRLFYTFGRYEAVARLLPTIVAGIRAGREVKLSHGQQVRDFTDVEDFAGAYAAALSAPPGEAAGTYHVGTGKGVAVRTLAEAAADAVGGMDCLTFGSVRTVDAKSPSFVSDPALVAERLGWRAHTDTLDRAAEVARWLWDNLPRQD